MSAAARRAQDAASEAASALSVRDFEEIANASDDEYFFAPASRGSASRGLGPSPTQTRAQPAALAANVARAPVSEIPPHNMSVDPAATCGARKALSYSAAVTDRLGPRTALDSACAPHHLLDPRLQQGPFFPAKIAVDGALNSSYTFTSACAGHVETRALDPSTGRLRDVRLRLPGT